METLAKWKIRIKDLLDSTEYDIPVILRGWVKTRRGSKKFSFVEVNDGSTLHNIQVIADCNLPNYSDIEKLT
ncbi:MAG: asparagine--tRNA ligase, partial [Nitrospinota bacterium]|nr:asparagine--tRNA ligase [Nitrospinota bacterium]